jgi:Tfp pilus assembly protein PilO
VTARDRIVIVAVLVAAALAGFWFVGLAPKRKEAADLQAQIASENQRLTEAQQKASAAKQAKERYRADYAAIAKLGKAVPKGDALPSLVYQLQSVSHSARIDFKSLKVAGGGGQGPTPSAATAAAASSSTASTPSAPAAAATQTAAATLPPGAAVGSAGFPTMPFSFVFNGTFFDMERFMREVQQFVRVNGQKVDVSGRLLAIDGFSLSAGPKGFPDVRANMSATAYLQSPQDTTSSSTSTSTSSSPTPSSSTSAGGTGSSEVTG